MKNTNCNVVVTELDFKVPYFNYSDELKEQLKDVEYVIAADGKLYSNSFNLTYLDVHVMSLLEKEP